MTQATVSGQEKLNKEFNDMFELKKKYFRSKYKKLGVEDENLELLSIKVATIAADFDLEELHKVTVEK